jgi:hypothetical protein
MRREHIASRATPHVCGAGVRSIVNATAISNPSIERAVGTKATRKRRPLSDEQLLARKASRKMQRRDEAAAFVFGHLCRHPCVDCGERDPLRLTFDHVRGEKICDVSTAHSTKTWSVTMIAEEIEKCDVRCWNCHMERTARAFGYRGVRLWDQYRGLA